MRIESRATLHLVRFFFFAACLHAVPSASHDQGYAFARVDEPTNPAYSPDPYSSYNDGGGAITITRATTGSYSVEFEGVGGIGNGGGSVQVSALGASPGACKVAFWSAASVDVRCFDAAGAPADRRFTVLYLRPDDHPNSYGLAWASQPTTSSYTADALYAYNAGSSGPVTIERHRVGSYSVRWEALDAVGSGNRIDLVTAYGTDPNRCQVWSTFEDGMNVRCHDPSGRAVDAFFVALSLRGDPDWGGLAFALADSPLSSSYAPPAEESFNAASGGVTATRTGRGVYSLEWQGLDAIGINRGHIQVSARGFDERMCLLADFGTDSADVRCFDDEGSPADSAYALLALKPPKTAWVRDYAFLLANLPTAASYTALDFLAHNSMGALPSVVRHSIGSYSVTIPGLVSVPGEGHVQVTAWNPPAGSYCKIQAWLGETVSVDCYDRNGAAADVAFTLLFLEKDPEATSVAFAWADAQQLPSYTPFATRSQNSSGTILATRTQAGVYAMEFAGFGTTGFNSGHVQVSATGFSNTRCEVSIWIGDTVGVRCTSPTGVLVDSPYNVLYLRPDAEDSPLAFAWAELPTSSGYEPSPSFSFNSADGPIAVSRIGTGRYELDFDGFGDEPLEGGSLLVTSYNSSDRRCVSQSWVGDVATVVCYDRFGNAADSRFNVLYVGATTNTLLAPVEAPDAGFPLLVCLGAVLLVQLGGSSSIRRSWNY